MPALLWSLLLAQAAAPTPGAWEARLVERALMAHGLELAAAPEGLPIEAVEVEAGPIFDAEDPWPELLNLFHVRTREAVIRRELLLRPGEAYRESLARESERNLRGHFILSAARVVAAKGARGGVTLLVVTKDRFSLRLNSDFVVIGSLLQYLLLKPAEMNFLGLDQQAALDFILRLDTLQVGESYTVQRLGGTALYASQAAALVFNRASGVLEGSAGAAAFGVPLRSLDQAWGAMAEASWNVRTRRVFRGASVWAVPLTDDPDGPSTPYVYGVKEGAGTLSATRSLGHAVKLLLTGTLGAWGRRYGALPAAGLSGEQAQAYADAWLPRSESATYAQATALLYQADFRVLHGINSYDVSEDFQLGPRLLATARWAVPTAWSTGAFLELGATARWRGYARDDFFSVSVAAASRLRPNDGPANQRVAFEVLNVSPPFEGGRVVVRVLGDFINHDLSNRHLLLGGSNGLRGAAPEWLSGKNLLLANVEYRLRPFRLLDQWLGLVVFTDVGSAYDVTPRFSTTVGMGLRVLLPHFNQEVIRLDLGVVVAGPAPGLDRLNATYGQVTDLRPGFLDAPL